MPLEHTAYGPLPGVLHPTALSEVENPDGSTPKSGKNRKEARHGGADREPYPMSPDNNARIHLRREHPRSRSPGRGKSRNLNGFGDADCGLHPSLVTGVWVGNSRGEEMKRGADGSVIAAPIWKQYMTEALKDSPVESFTKPNPSNATKPAILGTAFAKKVKIDTVSGKLATEFTPPELIEEKTFFEPHSILHYVNISDPLGQAPERPEQDPQYQAWEQGVKAWTEREQWNATSTPPTEYDDVHTKDMSPSVIINSPINNADIKDRAFTIDLNVSAGRPIRSVKAITEGYVLGASFTPAEGYGRWVIEAEVPNGVEKGFHTLSIEAEDDVGNRGVATLTINILAETQTANVTIEEPRAKSSISLDQFPINVRVHIDDVWTWRARISTSNPRMENGASSVQIWRQPKRQ